MKPEAASYQATLNFSLSSSLLPKTNHRHTPLSPIIIGLIKCSCDLGRSHWDMRLPENLSSAILTLYYGWKLSLCYLICMVMIITHTLAIRSSQARWSSLSVILTISWLPGTPLISGKGQQVSPNRRLCLPTYSIFFWNQKKTLFYKGEKC